MADLVHQRPIYHCTCGVCHAYPVSSVALDHQAINRVMALLDERQRRLLAGLLAQRRGHGGILALAEITGLSRTTIRRGIEELRSRTRLDDGRIRQAGGGRKRLEKKSRRW